MQFEGRGKVLTKYEVYIVLIQDMQSEPATVATSLEMTRGIWLGEKMGLIYEHLEEDVTHVQNMTGLVRGK